MPNPKKVLESAKRAEVKLRALAKAKVRVHAAAVRRLAKAREQAERAAMRGSRKAITRERRLVTADFQAFKTATPTEKARVKRTIESQIGRLRKIEDRIEMPSHTASGEFTPYQSARAVERNIKAAALHGAYSTGAKRRYKSRPLTERERASEALTSDTYMHIAGIVRDNAIKKRSSVKAAPKKGGPKKPPSPAQLAARAKFVAMVRAKAAKKGK